MLNKENIKSKAFVFYMLSKGAFVTGYKDKQEFTSSSMNLQAQVGVYKLKQGHMHNQGMNNFMDLIFSEDSYMIMLLNILDLTENRTIDFMSLWIKKIESNRIEDGRESSMSFLLR